MATFDDLRSWMERDISRFSNIKDHVIIRHGDLYDDGRDAMHIVFFTNDRRYSITAREGSAEKPNGYLGAMGQSRKPRAGEDWTRGNDLLDGPLTETMWYRILGDIISYELVKVHSREEALKDAELPQSLDTPHKS